MSIKKRYKTVGTKKELLQFGENIKEIHNLSKIPQDYAKVKLIVAELEEFGTVITTVNDLWEFEHYMELWENETGKKFMVERYMQPNFFKISRKK